MNLNMPAMYVSGRTMRPYNPTRTQAVKTPRVDAAEFYANMSAEVTERAGLTADQITVLARSGRVSYLADAAAFAVDAVRSHGPANALARLLAATSEINMTRSPAHGSALLPDVPRINMITGGYQLPALPGHLRSRVANDCLNAAADILQTCGSTLEAHALTLDQRQMPWHTEANAKLLGLSLHEMRPLSLWVHRLNVSGQRSAVLAYLTTQAGTADANSPAWNLSTRSAPVLSSHGAHAISLLLKAAQVLA